MIAVVAQWIALATMLLSTALLPAADQGDSTATSCLYPSAHERFGVTVGGDIDDFDVSVLPAAGYMDWGVRQTVSHPNGMIYYPLVYTGADGIRPSDAALAAAVEMYPGATWMIGNEAETVWMDNVTPEEYARSYHAATTFIRSLDPTAKFAFTSVATVSTLRLAWLDKTLAAYRSLYGAEPTVDMWTVHTYVVNEMANEWGAEIPTGIPNAVGYTGGWAEATLAGASGGTVHQSRQLNAKAYFAFQGSQVTLYLRTGPDSGKADIYLDHRADPVETVDLYSATAGSVSRTYTGLLPSTNPRLGNRHHVRVQVTGAKNPASSNTWVRVDAIAAPSTVGQAGGRLENNDPMRARIVTSVNDHDNISMIADQVRAFRQWMADNGQRHKPLVNSEYGILMTEDLGFDYARVRAFMLNSFDLFVNDLKDPQLGLPEDDNRMLQQWFWFALNQDTFEGRVVHTGLYSNATKQIKPLGQEFINYVQPLVQSYVDLEVPALRLTPTWPLFAGERSLVQVQGDIVNRGNAATGPFVARLTEGASVVQNLTVPGLDKRFEPGYRTTVTGTWRPVVNAARTVTLTADAEQQTTDRCRENNVLSATLEPLLFTDLALANLRTEPGFLYPIPHGGSMTLTLKVDLLNLGSLGTSAGQIAVKFWDGDPDSGGTPLHTETLVPGSAALPVTLTYRWPERTPGVYNVTVTVTNVSEDTNLSNNRQSLRVLVPAANIYFPHYLRRFRMPTLLEAPQNDVLPAGKSGGESHFLPGAMPASDQ